jgi:S1-C subfamily serine protease
MHRSWLKASVTLLLAGCVSAALVTGLALKAQEVDKRVLAEEEKRVAAVEKVRPAVVAIFAKGGAGGGSGVLIDKEGYALTNFHVVQGSGPVMQCGLPDGILYDAVLVGLDKVGDVALVKLLPKQEGKAFPFAPLGDSDKVKAGDWSLAMGNPFLLATDYTPTVTFGLISGVHRYQYPEGGKGLLEYTDCIQIDTSINPGNSGGPLFNMNGELIGINGRGSFDKRGRVNSGVGYAISINQIKNFLGHLYAGIDTDHATLGATVETEKEEEIGLPRLTVRAILDDCDAHRRGLEPGDELIEFAGRPMGSVNQFKNIVGIFPKGWRMPFTYRHKNEKKEVLVRLMGYLAREIDDTTGKPAQPPQPQPQPTAKPAPKPDGPAGKLYEPKPGFSNYHFNKIVRERLMAGFKKQGDFSGLTGEWAFEGTADLPRKKGATLKVNIREEKGADGKSNKTMVYFDLDGVKYDLEPLKRGEAAARQLKQPNGSGGIMLALHAYRQLLTLGEKGFVGQFAHGGSEPFYPPRADGAAPKALKDLRVDTEVLTTEEADVAAKWYFSLKDQTLLGFEVWPELRDDPCEVYFYDYKAVDGRNLPHKIEVRYGNERYGTFNISQYKLAKAN